MSGIFSNRFFQGGIAIAVIGIAFFVYQNSTGGIVDSNVDVTTAGTSTENSTIVTTAISEGQIEAHQVYVAEDNKSDNTINKSENSDSINTSANETVE